MNYGSRGFLKLAGPLSGFLIGCWVNLGVPLFVPGTPRRRSGCPALGDVTAGEHRGWPHGGGWPRGTQVWPCWHARPVSVAARASVCTLMGVCSF